MATFLITTEVLSSFLSGIWTSMQKTSRSTLYSDYEVKQSRDILTEGK